MMCVISRQGKYTFYLDKAGKLAMVLSVTALAESYVS
jgi:hypothetical protein